MDAGRAVCIYVVLRLCPFCSPLPKIFRITIGLEDKADTHTHTHTHTHMYQHRVNFYIFFNTCNTFNGSKVQS